MIKINTNENENIFITIWVFFQEHSRFTGQQGKGEAFCLTPLYHFHPIHRHLDINQEIAAERSPLHIASSRTRSGNVLISGRKSLPSVSYTTMKIETIIIINNQHEYSSQKVFKSFTLE